MVFIGRTTAPASARRSFNEVEMEMERKKAREMADTKRQTDQRNGTVAESDHPTNIDSHIHNPTRLLLILALKASAMQED